MIAVQSSTPKSHTVLTGHCGLTGTWVMRPLLIVGAGSSWFYMQAGKPWLAVAGGQILAVAIAMFMMLGNTILADICDVDELRTRTRREGVFSGIFTMTNKTVFALGTLLSGYLVTWSGFAGNATPSPETIHTLRLLYAIGPCACAVLAMLATIPFPITAASAAEVQRQLQLRARENGTA